ncbi:MAG: class I SAM-dependent methyltransferase [Candidatus Sericytochromatia bacterium]|nr:class I SAM-dependent methyltransferase [Candidatus Sericytochromatia bacterium]
MLREPLESTPDETWWQRPMPDDLLVWFSEHMADLMPAASAAQAEMLRGWLDPPPGAILLEVACGEGRYAIPLAKAGYRVMALDYHANVLAFGKRRAEAEGVRLEWLEGDMRGFQVPRTADVALCTRGFGMFATDAEHRRTLQAINMALKTGGKLFIDVPNRDCQFLLTPETSYMDIDGAVAMLTRSFDLWTSRMHYEIKVRRPDSTEMVLKVDLRLYTLAEMVTMLQETGFHIDYINGSLESPEGFEPVMSARIGFMCTKQVDALKPARPGAPPPRPPGPPAPTRR